MKKVILGILLVLIIPKINAKELFDINWNFGSVGFGTNLSGKNDDSIEFTVSILGFIFEQKDINLGFELNPIKCWYIYMFQDESGSAGKYSFLNLDIYWDPLDNKNILLGPFLAINYFFIDEIKGINMKEFTFSGGVRFSYKINDKRYSEYHNSKVLNADIGYRNITGRNKFYFSVSADIILALIGIGIGKGVE